MWLENTCSRKHQERSTRVSDWGGEGCPGCIFKTTRLKAPDPWHDFTWQSFSFLRKSSLVFRSRSINPSREHPPSPVSASPVFSNREKGTKRLEAPRQQLQALVFKLSVLISSFKWMQLFMHGAICRAEYSCGYGAGCPCSGQRKVVFLSPSLFWHADKEQKGKETRRRQQSRGLPWSSPQTSWHRKVCKDLLLHLCWCQMLPIGIQLI